MIYSHTAQLVALDMKVGTSNCTQITSPIQQTIINDNDGMPSDDAIIVIYLCVVVLHYVLLLLR